jgi:hypothetical protein
MRSILITISVVAIISFVFLIPMVPASAAQGACVFCPNNHGVDYASIGYLYLGVGAFHTASGSLGFRL